MCFPDVHGYLKSIRGPNPQVILDICIMIFLALKCSDASAPVEIICKEADGKPPKMSVTGALTFPQLANRFLESSCSGFL